MSDFFGKLKSGAGKVAFETEKMGRVTRAKSELDTLNRQLEELFSELGKATYRQITANEPAAMDEIVGKIEVHKQRIVLKENEYQSIKAEVYSPPGSQIPTPAAPPTPVTQPGMRPVDTPPPPEASTAPFMPPPASPVSAEETFPEAASAGPKHCPNCGFELAPQAKFCTNCGNKV